MNSTDPNVFRILAIALSTRGFGFAVMEMQNSLIAYAGKEVKKNKNVGSLSKVEELIAFYQPDALVLQDMEEKGPRRARRVRSLNRQIMKAAGKHKLKVTLISGEQTRIRILGNPKGTKYEMAEKLASDFPEELASRMPRKRRTQDNEDPRMDIFDAVALAVAHFHLSPSFSSRL